MYLTKYICGLLLMIILCPSITISNTPDSAGINYQFSSLQDHKTSDDQLILISQESQVYVELKTETVFATMHEKLFRGLIIYLIFMNAYNLLTNFPS